MLYLRIRRKELKIRSNLCRLPSAVYVMLNLSIVQCVRRVFYRVGFLLYTLILHHYAHAQCSIVKGLAISYTYCGQKEPAVGQFLPLISRLGHPFFFRLLSNAFSDFGSVGRKKKKKTEK